MMKALPKAIMTISTQTIMIIVVTMLTNLMMMSRVAILTKMPIIIILKTMM